MEPHRNSLIISVWLAVLATSAVFIAAALAKLDGGWIGRFEEWGYRPNFAVAIGVLELIGAVALLIPWTSAWAALGLMVIMFGALWTHVSEADWISASVPASLIGLLGFVLFGRVVCGRIRA